MVDLAAVPGFRRRIHIQPGDRSVRAAVEDDFHAMAVVLHHDGTTIVRVDAMLERAPWTTCPGAVAQLVATFTGVTLDQSAARGDKRSNCTHLYDMALLGAAHAGDRSATIYDILVSDNVMGVRIAEIRRNGARLLGFESVGNDVVAPSEIAGRRIEKLRLWIAELDPALQEPARLLQWGALLAHGRSIPMSDQSDASRLPPNCYTFQPERSGQAVRVGKVVDFSAGGRQPLDR